MSDVHTPSMSRRLALGAGAAAVTGAMVARAPSAFAQSNNQSGGSTSGSGEQSTELPVREIENIIRSEGMVSHGLLTVPIVRKDMTGVTVPTGQALNGRRIPYLPPWEINGAVVFQSLGNNRAIFNGDLPFKTNEVNPAIAQMTQHGIDFQALHQHFMDLHPNVYYMHFRGVGDPLALAHGISAILSVTSAPLPQTLPRNPQSPMDMHRISQILNGEGYVHEDGCLHFQIPRADQISLQGVQISPRLNVFTNVKFQPLDQNGQLAAVAPDFSMIATEIQDVMRVMQRQGWAVHCLYNQETEEVPQLFYSHQLKVGNPYQLAQEVRRGLDQTNSTARNTTVGSNR